MHVPMQVDVARARQHHHEGHQRPVGMTDRKVAEVPGVNQPLLVWQCGQAQKCFGR
jgi:hypothetical protein